MLEFSAQITSTTLIDGIDLYNGETKIGNTITDFTGNPVADSSEFGNYIVLSWVDNSADEYTVTEIRLKSGESEVAVSDPVSIVKPANKPLNMRVSAHFEGANLCSFNSVTIVLPYATKYRQGVVRLANGSTEEHTEGTVLSAADTLTAIEDSLSNDPSIVRWDTVNETGKPIVGELTAHKLTLGEKYQIAFTDNGNSISLNGPLTGDVVATTPSIDNYESGTPYIDTEDSKIITASYLKALYVGEWTNNTPNGLPTVHAVESYVTSQLTGQGNDLVHKSGDEEITGAKTFTGGVVAKSITGDAVQSSVSDWDHEDNSSKLPTVAVVSAAIAEQASFLSTDIDNLDNSLQSQIDALNAGQNLADIVNTRTELKSHSVTNLKAKGDQVSADDETVVYSVGDKIQVLHDTSSADGTDNDAAENLVNGVATVYELVKASVDNVAGERDLVSLDHQDYYWRYIGEYGCGSYSKSESDATFIAKSNIDTSITSNALDTQVPSSKAVWSALSDISAGMIDGYVKLESEDRQDINSELAITGEVSINDLHFADNKISSTANGDDQYSEIVLDQAVAGIYLHGINETTPTHVSLDNANRKFDVTINNIPTLSIQTDPEYPTEVSGSAVATFADAGFNNGEDGRLLTVDYANYLDTTSKRQLLGGNNKFSGENSFKTVIAESIDGGAVYKASDFNNNAETFNANNTQLPTVGAVDAAIKAASSEAVTAISETDKVGSLGLFLYTEVGAEKGIGSEIDGTYLRPVGLSLPMSGQISYKSATPVPALSGKWKLLSLAMKRTDSEPCLVLAQKVSE